MELTKEILITEFKKNCNKKTNYDRHVSCTTQYQRNVWVLDTDIGRLMIKSEDDFFTITCYPKATLNSCPMISFSLTEKEYKNLKAHYFTPKY